MKTKYKVLLVIGLVVVISASFYLFQGEETALAGSGDNLFGYAWSDNIGWISFNNCDIFGSCSGPDYGVKVDSSGLMSGHAWSDNIGWISFQGLGGCPEGTCEAKLDRVTGQVTGWARACTVFQNDSTCSGLLKGPAELGGWDGWIKLSGDIIDNAGINIGDYGVSANSAPDPTDPMSKCDWSGWAWGGDDDDPAIPNDPITGLEGDEVIGWIKFFNDADGDGIVNNDSDSPADYGVKGTGDACKDVNAPTLRITPLSAVLEIGDIQQFIAWYDSDGAGPASELNVTIPSSWLSSKPARVEVISQGMVEAKKTTSTPASITASYSGLSATAQVIVNPAPSPLSVSCSVSPSPALINQSITWTALPSGGTPPYISYLWSGDILGNAQYISTTYSTIGIKTAKVTVADSAGVTADATCSVDIKDAPAPSSRPWWWWIWQEK